MENMLTSIIALALILGILIVPIACCIIAKRLKQIINLLTIIADYYRSKKIVHLNKEDP